MKFTLLVLICTLLLVPAATQARTWLVRQDGSGDCTTIQACCDSAGSGDTVLVAAGTYSEHVIAVGSHVLLSEGGPLATVIVAPSVLNPVLRMGGAGTVVDGFTLRNGYCLSGYIVGGAYVSGGTLRNCLLINNTSAGIDVPGPAGGIWVVWGGIIEGNTIVSNGEWVEAGGIYCGSTFTGQIVRNIVVQNTDGYGIYCEAGASPTFICNNVWANADGEYGGACADPTSTNGNISVDPLFCAPVVEDFYLRADSPCLNAPGCGLIGAFAQGCPATSVEERPTTWGRMKVLFR